MDCYRRVYEGVQISTFSQTKIAEKRVQVEMLSVNTNDHTISGSVKTVSKAKRSPTIYFSGTMFTPVNLANSEHLQYWKQLPHFPQAGFVFMLWKELPDNSFETNCGVGVYFMELNCSNDEICGIYIHKDSSHAQIVLLCNVFEKEVKTLLEFR